MTAPRKMPDWAYNQMIDGLQKLLVLRLQGAPPADTITALATVWEEALTPITWAWTQEQDGARLPSAFSHLIQTSARWVSPAQLIEQIPKRPEPVISGLLESKRAPLTETEKAEHQKRMQKMFADLDKFSKERSLKPPPPRKPEDLLYEHYLVYDPKTGQKRDQPLPDKRKKKS